jgi:hypothetical protein
MPKEGRGRVVQKPLRGRPKSLQLQGQRSLQEEEREARSRLRRLESPSPGNVIFIDTHGLKIQGWGYLMFFAKIPRGGQGFQEKLPGGGVPLFRVLFNFY